jgi:fructan beta-fructosidase
LADEPRPDLLIADFEGETYGDWRVEGTAFGERPARGTLPGQMQVSGFEGKQLVNSFVDGDDSTGKLTSPTFTIERPHLNFLVGGGKYPAETCINLLVDGKVVRPNDRPGGSEQLDWASWDVRDLIGKTATLEIVDARRGGWGHINIDHIVQSDRSRALVTLERTLTVDERYLHLPVQNGAPQRRVRLLLDNQIVREFEIELATDGKPHFETFCDLVAFRGRKLTIAVERLPAESRVLDSLVLSDTLPAAEELYQEPKRPQFHFTSRRGWLNDPNGLVYYKGQWHLFYQHNPYGWAWGNMHWGHAVSNDLLHWQEQPIALYPQRYGDFAFSGSAVIDNANTAGFKTGSEDMLVAAYTSTGRGECIVYSDDGGRTWTKYEHNPVVKHRGRDPKLLWHAPTKRWVMALYTEADGKQWIAFYTSPDLKKWEFASRIEGFYECPDLFELPVLGKPGEKASLWVLYGADGKYLLGAFDGRMFKPIGPKQQLWYGNFYAAQTYSNAPDNRRVQIGWARGVEFHGMPFNQQMTIPVELRLRQFGNQIRMTATPVAELEKLATSEAVLNDTGEPISDTARIALTITPAAKPDKAIILVRGLRVECDFAAKIIRCKDVVAPLELDGEGQVQLDMLLDRGSLEIFVNEGLTALSIGHDFSAAPKRLLIATSDDGPKLKGPLVRELKSVWKR